jgi:hypothetical protein
MWFASVIARSLAKRAFHDLTTRHVPALYDLLTKSERGGTGNSPFRLPTPHAFYLHRSHPGKLFVRVKKNEACSAPVLTFFILFPSHEEVGFVISRQ